MERYIPQNNLKKHQENIRRNQIILEDITDKSALDFIYYLNRFEDIDRKLGNKIPTVVKLIIDSYGGDVYACFSIISTIKEYQKKGWIFESHVKSKAMSAGFFISLIADKRYAQKLSTLLFHDSRSFKYGVETSEDVRRDYELTKKLNQTMIDMVVEHTKLTEKKLKQYIRNNEDFYMTAQEALKFGVIDEIS